MKLAQATSLQALKAERPTQATLVSGVVHFIFHFKFSHAIKTSVQEQFSPHCDAVRGTVALKWKRIKLAAP
ncbi:hypothetical protein [Polaromonas sp.]|uniref:hypothetical protein n=1 Tax=Polaromonas sp. TaxID=1869339 RepID=UPI0013BA2BD8|nr:hypothetical protein [Polaromonas sp.]NDP61790.1 hypothetical protein [Polaromonas sp.]